MLVRSGTEGDWLPLRPLDGLPEGGVRAMCGSDVGAVLELDERLPVVAWGPWPTGADAPIDAVCLTGEGEIELVVATHGESPRDTLWRIVDVAASLQGTTIEAFTDHCTELDGTRDLAAWLHERCGVDGAHAVANLRVALERGEFGVVVLTPDGAPALAQPLALLARSATRVRSFTVEVLRAGDVFAVDATLDATIAQPAPLVAARQPVAIPESASAYEPSAEPAPSPQPEPQLEAQLEAEPSEEDELQISTSTEPAFLASVDRLDHRTSAHLRWLHGALESLVDEIEYSTDGELVHVTGWRVDERRRPLYGLDSQGLLQLVLTTLPRHEQHEFAAEVASLLPDDADVPALVDSGLVEVDVPAHLDDQTLLEYLVDNLVEALPGGREAFGTLHRDEDASADTRDDYFEGVSSALDPEEGVDVRARLTAMAEDRTRSDAA